MSVDNSFTDTEDTETGHEVREWSILKKKISHID